MSAHEADHEVLLAETLAGERSRDDAEVVGLLSRCGHCRERLEELLGLAAGLDGAGREQRRVLSELNDAGPAGGEERVENVLRSQRTGAGHPAVRMSRKGRYAVVVLAAAAVLAFMWLGKPQTAADEHAGFLGDDRTVLEFPLGRVDRFAPFRWSRESVGETFEVRVLDDSTPGEFREIEISPRLDEPTWTPTDTDHWPERIRWQLRVYGVGGAPRASYEGTAQRSLR